MFSKGVVVVCLVALLAAVAGASSTWKIVDQNYAAIAMSLSFHGQKTGWVAGSTSDADPLLLYTEDGGATLHEADVQGKHGVLMSISTSAGTSGIAGALGAAGLPCGLSTTDGKNWDVIHDGIDILCAVQDTTTPSHGVFVMIGEFSHPLHPGGDGIQISTDGGANWRVENWKQGISARYGKFLNANVGYVTGGEWPNNTVSRFTFPVQLSHYIHHDGKNFKINKAISPEVSGYQGVIARTDDSGKSWKTLVNWTTEGLYFNEISCLDANNCWVVAEGVNKTTGVPAAYIYGTTDGFKTIVQQQYFEHGSLMAVNMLSPKYGWAAGAYTKRVGLNEFTGTFFQWDGQKWTQAQQVGNFYAMDVSTVDTDYAYSAGLNELSLADLVQYAPH